MANNPIRTSDIYEHGDELKKLITDLKQVNTALEEVANMKNKLRSKTSNLPVTVNKDDQKALVQAAKDADKLQKAELGLLEARSKAAKELALIRELTRKANQMAKLEVKLAEAKKGSYDELSAQYAINVRRLREMSQAEREHTQAGQDLIADTADLREQMRAFNEQIGDNTLNVGNYQSAFEGLRGPFDDVIERAKDFRGRLIVLRTAYAASIQGLTGMSKALKIFKLALISTGIGAIVVALGAFVTFLSKTQRGLDLVSDVMAGVGAVISVVVDRFARLGSAIIKLFKGDFKGAVNEAKGAVQGLGEEIAREAVQVARLNRELRELSRSTRALDVAAEQARSSIRDLNKIAEDISRPLKDRENAALIAYEVEQSLAKERIKLAQSEIDKLKEKASLSNSLDADIEEIQKKEIELEKLKQESIELTTTLQNKLNQIRVEVENQENERQEKARKRRQDAFKETIEQSKIRLDTFKAEAEVEISNQNRVLEKRKTTLEEKIKARERITELENQIVEKGVAIRKQVLENELAEREISLERYNLEVDLIEKQRLADFRKNLDAQAAYFKSKIEEIRKEVVKNPVPPLVRSTPKNAWDGVVLDTTEGIQRIQRTIEENTPREPQSIFELFGLRPEGEAGIAFDQTVEFVEQKLFEFTNLRTQLAQQAVANADTEVQAAKQALQDQINAGKALTSFEVMQAERRLANAKKAQEKAKRERRKAVLFEIRLNTLRQASGLLTATAKIWERFGNPLLAIPAVALMWASFFATKARTIKLAKARFGKGKFLEINTGSSHASGDDTPLGVSYEGKPGYVEKGEGLAVYPKDQMRANGATIRRVSEALIDGSFARKFIDINSIPGPSVNAPAPLVSMEHQPIDTSRMEDHLQAIRNQNEARIYRNARGQLVKRYKNLETIYIN